MTPEQRKSCFDNIPPKTVTLANEKTTMNLLGRIHLNLSLTDSSGIIHTKPIDCYILEGIDSTKIILSLPDLVTHVIDLFIDLIKSAKEHLGAINMISVSNHMRSIHPPTILARPPKTPT